MNFKFNPPKPCCVDYLRSDVRSPLIERRAKSTLDSDVLHPAEGQKIDCGKRHFEALGDVNFKAVTRLSELTANKPVEKPHV